MSIELTPEAAAEIKRMRAKDKKDLLGLRLIVKGGGCSGLYYDMNFDAEKPGDHLFEFSGLKVFVDPKSYLYLKGTKLDYVDTLQDKGFRFINPQASKTCGCGESFSV